MQEIVIITEDSDFNYLKKILSEGWKVVSSENILSTGHASSYTSKLVYIIEKE